MFKGHLKVVADYSDGSRKVLVDEGNYVLIYPRAYHLFQMYTGGLLNDPIQSYQLGSGGYVNGAVVSSAGTNVINSVYQPLSCQSETVTTPIYDKNRLSKDVSYSGAITKSSTHEVTYTFYLDPEEAVGQLISEAGLVTRGGNLFCHRPFPTIPKTSDMRLTFVWTLKV